MSKRSKKSILRRFLIVLLTIILLFFAILVSAHVIIRGYGAFTLSDSSGIAQSLATEDRTAIVFGSAVNDITGEPRPIVRARLDAAHELYAEEHVSTIIVSGYEDNIANDYNEPAVMASYLVGLGVDDEDVVEDNQGDSSYQTCRQAKHGFELDAAVLVTQDSHIQRTLYLCRSMGINAYGITADAVSSNKGEVLQQVRETFSNVKAIADITLRYEGG